MIESSATLGTIIAAGIAAGAAAHKLLDKLVPSKNGHTNNTKIENLLQQILDHQKTSVTLLYEITTALKVQDARIQGIERREEMTRVQV